MKVEFVTEVHGRGYDTREEHSVLLDGKCMMSQCEGIEPEDVTFGRDLESPHGCLPLLEAVIAYVKAGGEVEITFTEKGVSLDG